LVALGVHSSSARAGLIISTPSGLNLGDKFFVVFLDSTPTTATSPDITTYNNAVATAASGITYPGGTIGAWQIIGATAASNEYPGLFNSGDYPIYDVKGDLLDVEPSIYQEVGLSPYIDQNGNNLQGARVWTGLLYGDGTPYPGLELGNDESTYAGSGILIIGDGIGSPLDLLSTNRLDLYGYALLTVGPNSNLPVPEPSTITIAFVGVIGLVVGRWTRRCVIGHQRLDPPGCPPTRS
jgi:hypothetical protein